MAEDHIRYDILTQDALRGVVRKVLSEVARTGLPGEHHFFITFATHAPGVRVSSRLLTRYPDDMTIVLQHQFWDLTVTEHGFEVGLSFNGIPERLIVPVHRGEGLPRPLGSVPGPVRGAGARRAAGSRAPARHRRERGGGRGGAAGSPAGAGAETPTPEAEDQPSPANEAQVVSLDAFRKKS